MKNAQINSTTENFNGMLASEDDALVSESYSSTGELMYKWQTNFCPDSPDSEQRTFWVARLKENGKFTIGYKLQPEDSIEFVESGTGMENMAEKIEMYGGTL